MKTSSYKLALGVMGTVCIALAIAVAYLLVGRNRVASAVQTATGDPVIARGASAGNESADQAKAGSGSEPELAAVQLSPQRMQEIGVTTAMATMKTLSNNLQAPGNVEINEEKLAYVQTRFPGWIQKVFANATYQYVRKGQPLFTVYSPDLVSSEQEYLLARKNQAAFAQTMHSESGHSESGHGESGHGMAHQET